MQKSYSACLQICQIDLQKAGLVSDIPINGLKDHANEVCSGDLFIALAKDQDQQIHHIQQALQRGAIGVLCASKNSKQQFKEKQVVYVPNLIRFQLALAQYCYNHPFEDMVVVAVTGTSGKTSVCYMVAHALEIIGYQAGYIGSLGYGDIHDLKTTMLTTPTQIQLHRMAHEINKLGKKHLLMEASAHGLVQGRLAGIRPQVGVLTSLGHDHLDYFASISEYHQSKVSQLIALRPKQMVANSGDSVINQFIQKNQMTDCFAVSMQSVSDAQLTGCIAKSSLIKQRLSGKLCAQHFELNTPLLGQAHALNALIALGVLHQLGIDLSSALHGLSQIQSIPGRVEKIMSKDGLCIIIDMAHTPGALKNLCQTIENRQPGSKVHCVLGCGGDRDTQKRPIMGQIAEMFCDHVILTNDNPRTEDPKQIVEDILAGMTCPYQVEIEYDRQLAIRQAIDQADDQDVVIVCGRGDERYQVLGHQRIPQSDQKTVYQALGLSE